MSFMCRAKIIVSVYPIGFEVSKYYVGTEEDIYREAHDWMEQIAVELVEERGYEDGEKDFIFDYIEHTIEWDFETPLSMFAVLEPDMMDPIYGIYPTYEEAEQAVEAACCEWAKDVIENQDPEDVIGLRAWDEELDYDWLVKNCRNSFRIQEVPVFGVNYK